MNEQTNTHANIQKTWDSLHLPIKANPCTSTIPGWY